ncbi:Gmad2 immunoglobulin-like domain-containing protein [Stomatohabitans albus]|uniref:Gmad2 immunoglobulin-like domain-containing protein n=1 Tax=Stomatohabitans albus TaxID=3110766 RepID=UPI00300D8EFD
MKLQFSSLAVIAFLLAGCTGTNPTNSPTPIDVPSDMVSASPASESARAQASEASEGRSDASEMASEVGRSSSSETKTGTSSSKQSEKAKPAPSASPSTVVSSDKADTTRDGGPIDIAPSAQTNTSSKAGSSLISVTTKEGGKGTIKLAGKADVYEGTVVATAVHSETGKSHTEFTTASCSNGCTGNWSINFSGLPSGTYKVNVSETDASDGEGKAPYSVDITVKVS